MFVVLTRGCTQLGDSIAAQSRVELGGRLRPPLCSLHLSCARPYHVRPIERVVQVRNVGGQGSGGGLEHALLFDERHDAVDPDAATNIGEHIGTFTAHASGVTLHDFQ